MASLVSKYSKMAPAEQVRARPTGRGRGRGRGGRLRAVPAARLESAKRVEGPARITMEQLERRHDIEIIEAKTEDRIRIGEVLERWLRSYAETSVVGNVIDTNRQRAVFPELYNHLHYLISFNDQELEDLNKDSRLVNARVLFSSVSDMDRRIRTIVSFIEAIRVWNSLLTEFPQPYRDIRSKILRELDTISTQYDSPLFLEMALRRDELITDQDISTLQASYHLPPSIFPMIEEYNSLRKELAYTERVERGEIVKGTMRPAKAPKPIVVKKMQQDLQDVREENYEAGKELNRKLRERLDEEKGERAAARAEWMKMHHMGAPKPIEVRNMAKLVQYDVEDLRKNVRKELAEATDRNPDDIKEEEINAWFIKRENLPYWVFLAEFASTDPSPQRTQTLLNKYPEISTQFIRLFQKLSQDQQVTFIESLFQRFPPEKYLDGPDRPVIEYLISFTNKSKKNEPDQVKEGMDFRLSEALPNEVNDIIQTLSVPQLLQYRSIVFTRLANLSPSQINNILSLYQLILTNPQDRLSYNEQRGVLIQHDSNSPTTPTAIDFTLPFTSETISEIGIYLNKNIPNLTNSLLINGKLPPSDQFYDLKIFVNNQSIHFLAFVKSRLHSYFQANLPIDPRFDELIIGLSHDIAERTLSGDLNIARFKINLPSETLIQLQQRLQDRYAAAQISATVEDLKQRAAQIGLEMRFGVQMAERDALAKLKKQLETGKINEQEYTHHAEQIKEIIEAYKQLEAKISRDDPDVKAKRRQAQKFYTNKVAELEKAAQQAGNKPDMDKIQADAWNAVLEAGILSEQELALFENKYLRDPRKRKQPLPDKTRDALQAVIKQMPDVLKQSLSQLIDRLSVQLNQVASTKKDEARSYYKFITDLIVASYDVKQNKQTQLIQEIVQKYSQTLPPVFIAKVLDLLQNKNATASDLTNYVSDYLNLHTSMIKNPLQRQVGRRRRRYDQLLKTISTAGTLTRIQKRLPGRFVPQLQECVLIHQLKPWMDLPDIDQWNFVIAHVSGLPREQIPAEDRIYFNSLLIFILTLPNGQKLHFYRPTSNYWRMHCQINHSPNDSIQCNVDNMIRTLTSGNKTLRIYELMHLPLLLFHSC